MALSSSNPTPASEQRRRCFEKDHAILPPAWVHVPLLVIFIIHSIAVQVVNRILSEAVIRKVTVP
ncbi:MAG: hypothetical protein R3E09_12225 [Novosphingobium sp.]